MQARYGVARQRGGECLLAGAVENAFALEYLLRGNALRARFHQLRQRADFLRQRPEHQRWGGGFALQGVQNALKAGGVACQPGAAQGVGVVAGNVQHGAFNVFPADFAGGIEQTEFEHFLMRGQQVAFDVVRQPFQRIGAGALVLAGEALRQPGGQARALGRDVFQRHGGFLQCGKPFGFARCPVEFGQQDERDQLRRGGPFGQTNQRFTPFAPGLAGGNGEFDDFGFAKQRKIVGGHEQLLPLETGRDAETFAFAETQFARARADGVCCFQTPQRVGTVNQVEGGEFAFAQVLRELFGLHCGVAAARRSSTRRARSASMSCQSRFSSCCLASSMVSS